MASLDRYVSETAKINAKRSIFPLSRRVLLSYFHGYLQPIGVPLEVLPGDTWKAKVYDLIQMSTPKRPIMDNIRFELDCWFVPKRIIWNKTKLFYGEAETFGIAEKIDEPYITNADSQGYSLVYRFDLVNNLLASEQFNAAFGLIDETDGDLDGLTVNVLPLRAFLSIWNYAYRDQNYQEPYKWDMDETGLVDEIAYLGVNSLDVSSLLPKVNKDKDIVISILPWQQKGDPVTLGLAGTAPIALAEDAYLPAALGTTKNVIFGVDSGIQGDTLPLVNDDTDGLLGQDTANAGDMSDFSAFNQASTYRKFSTNLVVDVSKTTAVTINNLLYALAYQDFLARAAHYGTKYKEYIYSMFGTTVADATEDVPEYLGRQKLNINVNRVLSTVEQEQGLGEQGAYSVTGGNSELFNHSFTEPGYLIFVGYCKHQRTYSSGIDKVFMKHELLDYYQPPFANIADVPFSSFEIFAGGDGASLGFQEPWYEYKSLQDRVYGILNPLMPNSLAYWTLAERFDEQPTINGDFIKEDRTALIDALLSGENGPDYIMDFEFRFEVTRVMPITSNGSRLGVF